ncbi:hypothetical protein T439DRAFT_225241 [Meredithblackwellia eburnea MCA 4105]
MGLLQALLNANIVKDTGKRASQGLMTYPLVELLVTPAQLCSSCTACGKLEMFPSLQDNEDDEQEEEHDGGESSKRFKRCARCKLVNYCSSACQSANWKSHKPDCFDNPADPDDEKAIEDSRRKALFRMMFGREEHEVNTKDAGARSKQD